MCSIQFQSFLIFSSDLKQYIATVTIRSAHHLFIGKLNALKSATTPFVTCDAASKVRAVDRGRQIWHL
jgi:hypothetical protein